MGRKLIYPVVAGQETLLNTDGTQHEKLLGLRSEVTPDGSSASLSCCFTNAPAFRWHISFEEMAPIQNTICQTANLMVTRASLAADGGRSMLLELCATALRPLSSDVVIDPVTGDRFFILQFADHAPLVIRRTIAEIEDSVARLREAAAKALN